MSVPSIAQKLGISKSTASHWLRGVILSDTIIQDLAMRSKFGRQKGHARIAAIRSLQEDGRRREATVVVDSVFKNQDMQLWKVVAALIFWCEGSKRHLSSLKLVNSDPSMIQTFMHALRHGYGAVQEKYSATLHLHGYHDEREMIQFWSKVTGIAPSRFNKTYIKPNSGQRKRENYPGCISLCYGDASLARRLDALYHSISKRMGV
jgi:hypothetical protein